MEKYSKFRDEATGIPPFAPAVKHSTRANNFFNAARTVYSVITVPLAMLSLWLYFAFFKKILPEICTEWAMTWILLIPLRIFDVKLTYEGEQKASVRKTTITKAQPGDVILSNFVSPLDAFVYRSFRDTVFAFPTPDGQFEERTSAQAMRHALSVSDRYANRQSLADIARHAASRGAVVVVFVEGTTSNGRGLLTLKGLDYKDISTVDGNVFASVIKYSPQYAASPLPSSLIKYIWHTSCSSWWYLATVKIASEPMTKSQLTADLIGQEICRLGRLRVFGDNLDLQAKREYATQMGLLPKLG